MGDLEAARLAGEQATAHQPERLGEEGLHIVGLQAPGLGLLQAQAQRGNVRIGQQVAVQCPLGQQTVEPRGHLGVDGLLEAGADLWVVAVLDRLQQDVTQGAALERLAEHVEDPAAVGAALLLHLVEQALEDRAPAGVGGNQRQRLRVLGEALLDRPAGVAVPHRGW